jgi:Ca2+-binding RTX toxin-like protein
MTISKTFKEVSDSYVVSTNDVYDLDFLGGDDVLRVITGTTTAHMGSGNDRVRVDGGSASLFGDEGADRFDFFGGVSTADGGADNDRFNIRGASNLVLGGGLGDDEFVFYAGAGNAQLSGGDGNDRFYGNHFAISGDLKGGAGNDAFYDFANLGGLTVTLEGGTGNDLYRVLSPSGPNISELSGEGTDTVQVPRGMSYALGANLENLRAIDALGTGDNATLSGNELANLITGSSGQDVINGLAGNDRLIGGAGNDVINGGDGNDRITGGLGIDFISGGAGSDVFIYTSAADESGFNGLETITDWESIDRIDLSAVDGNSLIDGQQHFHFAGYSFGHPPPTHSAGDIWIAGFATELAIIGFTDNDSTADFVIELCAAGDEPSLKAANLVL